MANLITKTTMIDGSRNLVVKIHINGDGTGEETDTLLIDASTYSPAFTESKLMKMTSNIVGFSAELNWDATVNTICVIARAGDSEFDFSTIGGISNDSGAGRTGDLLITTVGLGAADHGILILEFKKKDNV